MADISKLGVGGTTYTIKDESARTSGQNAVNASEYARQIDTDTYAGQSLAALFAGEIANYANVWAWLRARVRAGNFAGMRIKDFIDVTLTNGNVVRYRIGAVDPYLYCGDTSKGHHVAMVPSAPVAVAGADAVNGSYIMWNTTATNQGTADNAHPYLVSNLHRWETEVYYPMLPQIVRDCILNQRVLLETRYSASGALTASNNWAWADLGPVWSPSEMEVYGCCVWGTPGYSAGFDCQFPIFAQTKDRIQGSRVSWWLRSVSGLSSSYVCNVGGNGYAGFYSPTSTWIRPLPCFLVG